MTTKEYQKAYREANKEKVNAYQRAYYANKKKIITRVEHLEAEIKKLKAH